MKTTVLKVQFWIAILLIPTLFLATHNLYAQCSPADTGCAAVVCAADSFCCDTAWDSICDGAAAEEAACCDCVATPDPLVCNPCDQAQDGPGYAGNAACEAAVCATDSFCCETQWDGICAGEAASQAACCDCVTTPDPVVCNPCAVECTATSSTDVSCNSGADGTATVSPANGTAPYSYAWSNGQTTQTATGLAAGGYTVTVTDANGCTCTSPAVTVNEPATAVDCSAISSTNASCASSDGTATVTPSGGTAPYTYAWNNGATTQTATGLATGTYTVTVTDANGCACTNTVTVNEDPCPCDSATGTPGYPSDAPCEAAVCATDSFCCDVTWDGVCAGATAAEPACCNCVTTPDPVVCTPCTADCSVTAFTDATCNAGTDGTATVTPSGGTPPFTFLWSNGQTTQTATGLAAGNYTVTATDALSCSCTSAVITITEPVPIDCSVISALDVSCNGGADGEASVTPANGVAPYTYAWSDGQTTPTATGLAAGSYTVDVTDANGCMCTSSAIVVNEPTAVDCSTTAATDASCNGAADGTATVTPSGGTPPYTYGWSNGQTTQTVIGLAAGTYSVMVTDANGCTCPNTVTVGEPAAIDCSDIITTPTSCSGGTDGTATVTPINGVAPFTYAWSDGQTTQTASNLIAGIYSVTVTDATGCTCESPFVNITDPAALTCDGIIATDTSCFGDTDGTASVFPEGGTPPYTYLWSDGQTTQSAVGLVAGDYTVEVTDANGCLCLSPVITVAEPPLFQIDPAYVNANDLEGNLGSITPFWYNIHSFDILGGNPPYDIDFDHVGYANYAVEYFSGGATVTVSYADNADWSFMITDTNGCTLTTGEISNNDGGSSGVGTTGNVLDIDDAAINAESSVNADDGAIDITTGGCADGVLSYTWTGPNGFSAGTEDIIGLSAGLYTVVIECADGQITQGNYWVPLDRSGGRLKTDDVSNDMSVYPNPFAESTIIEIESYNSGKILLTGIDGQLIKELYNGPLNGVFQYTLNADELSLSSGLYLIVFMTDEEVKIQRVVLNR